MDELKPCRECCAPCSVQMFDGHVKATLWMCSKSAVLGGSGCADGNAYLSAEAWNQSAKTMQGDYELMVKRFRAIADLDEREGKPLGKCLLEAATAITALRAEVEALRGVCVVAAIPLEALIMSGGDAAHCQDVRDAIHDAVKTIRAALKGGDHG